MYQSLIFLSQAISKAISIIQAMLFSPKKDHSFACFVADNGHLFPYNSIRITRTSFHCKWLLCKGCGKTSLFCQNQYYILNTSALSLNTMKMMIVSSDAVPVPVAYNDIMDTVEWWGRRVSGNWQQFVLKSLMEMKQPIEKKLLHHIFLQALVREKITMRYNNEEIITETFTEYNQWYEQKWRPASHFFDIAIKTIEWIDRYFGVNNNNTAMLSNNIISSQEHSVVTTEDEEEAYPEKVPSD
jgi:hypothetical protein